MTKLAMNVTRKLAKTAAVGAILCSMAASAAAQSHSDTPLLVVRFNQDRVYYQQPLYNAVSRALEAKPSVLFNIVAVVPQTSSESANQQAQANTQARAGQLVGEMVKMGVPQSRLRVSYQKSTFAQTPEVHIFVQ
ncbi:MAG: hypothetical protein FJX23_02215 [Alphaproteobacteria bacterium]|nr:hypothetical protein [Alphaproteobacteria bacterium]